MSRPTVSEDGDKPQDREGARADGSALAAAAGGSGYRLMPRRWISFSVASARSLARRRASLSRLIANPIEKYHHAAGVLDAPDAEGVERWQPESRERES